MQALTRDASIGAVFAALSDPTRRAFVARLATGEAAISELATGVEMSLPAVSRHVRVLHEAGLVTREKRGRVTYLTLRPDTLRSARDWIDGTRAFWDEALERLAAHVEENP